MEPEVSLLCSQQQPTTELYPESYESGPQTIAHFPSNPL